MMLIVLLYLLLLSLSFALVPQKLFSLIGCLPQSFHISLFLSFLVFGFELDP